MPQSKSVWGLVGFQLENSIVDHRGILDILIFPFSYVFKPELIGCYYILLRGDFSNISTKLVSCDHLHLREVFNNVSTDLINRLHIHAK